MSAAEAVLLDAGGVLVLPNPWAVTSVLRAAGGVIEPGEVARLHYKATAAMDAVRDGDWQRYYNVLIEAAGVPQSNVDDVSAGLFGLYTAPAASLWNVVPGGLVADLKALAETGVEIAVVSNSDGTVEALLRMLGVPIDIIIDSSVVGFAKPQPEIFGFALEQLGVAPEHAVHVGDTSWADVDGALAAGVRPLHLDPYGDCPDADGHHEHVRSLADVVALVAE